MSSTNNLTNSGLPLDLNVNVNIRLFNGKGKLVQQINKHNKATRNMTEGIIKFLRGEFNSTETRNISSVGYDVANAKSYIPTHIGFGNTGTIFSTQNLEHKSSDPIYLESDYPQYSDNALRSEIFKFNEVDGIQENHRQPITRSTCVDSYSSDTYSLQLSTTINYTHNFKFYSNSSNEPILYYNSEEYGETKIIITELGLFSGDIDDGHSKLLARMLLDESTPLIIDKDSTVIVTWILGVYSVDDTMLQKPFNDYSYTEDVEVIQDIQWVEE